MKKFLIAATLLMAGNTLTAMASDKVAGAGPNPYSDCGIGAALFTDTKWAAVTSNVIWDIGTTAVTSATMSPQTCNGKSMKVAAFIKDTYEQLVEETATGEGAHLTAVLQLAGCSAAQLPQAASTLRDAVGVVVSQDGYSAMPSMEKAFQVYSAVDQSATVCNI
jgi:Protein of unknown function (DUF3015)